MKQTRSLFIGSMFALLTVLSIPLLVTAQTSGILENDTFTLTMRRGIVHEEVRVLQQFLNRDLETRLAEIGPGSLGNETNYFGPLTERAIQRFQAKYDIVSSGTPSTTGYGQVGPLTRGMINKLLKEPVGAQSSLEVPEVRIEVEMPPAATTTVNSDIEQILPAVPTPRPERAYVINEIGGTLSVIDTTVGKVSKTVTIAEGGGTVSALHAIVSSGDNSRLYVTDRRANKVIVISTDDLKVLTTIEVGTSPYGMAVSPDDRKLYVANFDSNTVSIIDTKTFGIVATVPVDRHPSDVTVTPDGKQIYVTHQYERTNTYDATRIIIIDIATNIATNVIQFPSSSRSRETVFAAGGAKAFVSIQGSDGVGVIDILDGSFIKTIYGMLNVNQMTVSKDGTKVYVVAATDEVPGTIVLSKIYIIDALNEKLSRQISGFNAPRGIALSPDDSKLYVTDRKTDAVNVVDLTTDTIVDTISVGDAPLDIVIVPAR